MKKINPYRPGAGLMPGVLAGREGLIENSKFFFEALQNGIPCQSLAYTGYRGVGKTVLLNKLQEIAENEYEISCYHIEVAKSGSFIAKLSDSCRKFIRANSAMEKAKSVLASALDALKAIEITYNPEKSDFRLSLQDKELYKNSDLSQGLQDLFSAIGELAKKRSTAVSFFIDEFQYTSQEEMDAFVSALHRANQLSLPIMALCAGTPEMIKMLYREKTYVERLFIFPKLEKLDEEAVSLAISGPGEKAGLKYEKEALTEIFRITEGYPYFVQQYGQIICNNANEAGVIDRQSVLDVLDEYYRELDNNFYMIRFADRGALEKECLIAMSHSESLPCNISFVAKETGRTTKQIAPTLSRLKNKGLISYDNINDIDFTVPGFVDYLKRNHWE